MPPVLSPAYRLVIRLEIDNRPGMFAEVARTIGARGGSVPAVGHDDAPPTKNVRAVTVDTLAEPTGEGLTEDLRKIPGFAGRAVSARTFLGDLGGKVAIAGRV